MTAPSLSEEASVDPRKVLNPEVLERSGGVRSDRPMLVVLAAGQGTRFGKEPKCAQPVRGVPLARHSMVAFRALSSSPPICIVGYRSEEVMAALGGDNVYVLSSNPTGGTAFAAWEAFSVSALEDEDPILFISMGDRVISSSVFRKLHETHTAGPREADLTFLTAIYETPRNQGKGRIVRDREGRVVKVVEQREIDVETDARRRQEIEGLTEGNCPLYAIRAACLKEHLSGLTNDNAQRQYYLTDIVEAIGRGGGVVRTVTTRVGDPEYDFLCSDVTRPMDLALLEGVLGSSPDLLAVAASGAEAAARAIASDRPAGQVASIALQLEELLGTVERERLGFRPDRPVGIGISGGRLRIAFMHPDMGRFFGPAWQMPIGAGDASGREQIAMLVQCSDDGKIHLYPTDPQFREKLNAVPADDERMYPGEDVGDWYSYEDFGTRMAENLLLSLGYFTDQELEARRGMGHPLPPPSLWIRNSLRRPFSLIGNAIASLRTLRKGNLGARVQSFLGRDRFHGLRLVSTGNIPQGGFSSSSAVTVAVKNALNALFELGIPPDLLIHLACQAEYGTGVRAGSLDQATEQKGKAGQGALISSNPRDNYRVIGAFPVPVQRFHLLFPYSVDRDRASWQWSRGVYAPSPEPGRLTAGEMRKLTGKAAEIAAVLVRLPLELDFFKQVEEEFLENGTLGPQARRQVLGLLRELPLTVSRDRLRQLLEENRRWLIQQLIDSQKLDPLGASERADSTLESLLAGWRDPVLRRALPDGSIVEEQGVPLRAMVAYLFFEVAKNFHLIHHPEEWIGCVSLSQRGDRCFDIEPDRLPSREEMEAEMDWERGCQGPALMELWLERFGATPFDHNRGLDDRSLSVADPPPLHLMEGGNFFRGLALIDLAEAMLRRAFGPEGVAVRINAAGQGDFFQAHVDTTRAAVDDVKGFIRRAFYRRFGLAPEPEFVELHPGGPAVGVRLSRFDQLRRLIDALRSQGGRSGGLGR